MSKNKILDKIFKKLIKRNFVKSDIYNFIKAAENYSSFNDFIYYLLLLTEQKRDALEVRMAKEIISYINYLISTLDVKKISIFDFTIDKLYSNKEIYLAGCKGFGNQQNIYFDIDENCYILLTNKTHDNFNNIFLNISYNKTKKHWIDSSTNAKISKSKKILIFSKEGDANRFLGFYEFFKNTCLYVGEEQFYSFLVINIDYKNKLNENYERFISSWQLKQKKSLAHFKKSVNDLLTTYNCSNDNIQKIINRSTDHFLLLTSLVEILVLKNRYDILQVVKQKYITMLSSIEFNVFNLVSNISILNELQIALIANNYDILMGEQIAVDYLDNITLVVNNFNLDNGYYNLKFYKSFKNKPLNLEINKKIFNTTQKFTSIKIFEKINKNYLFKGLFKVSKISLLNNELVFRLIKISEDKIWKYIKYNIANISDNSYKNSFINQLQSTEILTQFSDNIDLEKISSFNKKNERNDSISYKFNWVIQKLIKTDEVKFAKYQKLYFSLNNKIINNIIDIYEKNFSKLIENKLLKPWTIACELMKLGYHNKELQFISFADCYYNPVKKYKICNEVINKIR